MMRITAPLLDFNQTALWRNSQFRFRSSSNQNLKNLYAVLMINFQIGQLPHEAAENLERFILFWDALLG